MFGSALELADRLAGVEVHTDHSDAGIDRLMRIVCARWLAVNERELDDAARYASASIAPAVVSYLDRLVADGYTLSDAEAELRTELSTLASGDDADEDEGDDVADDAA